MKLRRRTAAIAVALAATLAGAAAAVANAAAATGQHPGITVSGANSAGPRINWDCPLPDGQALGKTSSMQTARTEGRLPFLPATPQFGLQPILIQVANTDTAVGPDWPAIAWVYHFPIGKAFTVDGRVRVLEYQTKVTEKVLEAVAADPPGPAADFTVIQINGHGALLIHANGIGRVQFVLRGVMYDVTGPAVSPQEAEHLASEIRPA